MELTVTRTHRVIEICTPWVTMGPTLRALRAGRSDTMTQCYTCGKSHQDGEHLALARLEHIAQPVAICQACVGKAISSEMGQLWTEADERRADVIAQNGNTGEHYGKTDTDRLEWLLRNLPGNITRQITGVNSDGSNLDEWCALIDMARSKQRDGRP